MDKVIVGLGNPGARYEGTRHNVGWMVLDRLAERAGTSGRVRARDGAASVRARLDDAELLLVKPTTYMNLSGTAVRAVLARERVPLREALVVVDDLALPLGRMRLRERGSDGGHNGLRSIIAEMGTQAFSRLRIGIGRPSQGAIDHVLGTFRPEERALLDEVIDAAADCVIDWATTGTALAAGRWNGWRGGLDDVADPPRPSQAPEVAASAEPHATGAAAPGPEGIVRTAHGWRRLLPRPGGGRGSTDG